MNALSRTSRSRRSDRTSTSTRRSYSRREDRVSVKRTEGNPVGKPLRNTKNAPKSIAFKPRTSFLSLQNNSKQKLIYFVGSLVAIVLIAVGVFMAFSYFSSRKDSDTRIEDNTSQALAAMLKPALDQADKLRWIAAHTSQYPDPRIIELALKEPAALDFAYNYPNAKKEALPYDKQVMKGTAPLLYTWDPKWAYSTYGGMPLAVTGSAPTVLSMAYMGMSGSTDKTPADMAKLAADGGFISEKGQTSVEFFAQLPTTLGIKTQPIDGSESSISKALSERHFVIAHVKAAKDSVFDSWILIADHQQNGALTVYDPLSKENSSHLWDPATIKDMSSDIFEVLPVSNKK